MDGLLVSELARRSGVPASTVRFYEQRGLLPARRSPSGYRLYDDEALHRLTFIRTAKDLGLPLPEIRTLLDPWQYGRCADVRRTLLPLVERRIDDAHARADELTRFTETLERAHAQLRAIERDGPCDPSCAFLGRGQTEHLPAPRVDDGLACRLDDDGRELRSRRWSEALSAVTHRRAIPGGVQLDVAGGPARIVELAALAEAERQCCPFFEFTLHVGSTTRLDVRAPAEALVLVHELVGEPSA